MRARKRPEAPTFLLGWGHRLEGHRVSRLNRDSGVGACPTTSPGRRRLPSGPGLETFPGRLGSFTLGRHTLGKVRGHRRSQRPLDGLRSLSGRASAESVWSEQPQGAEPSPAAHWPPEISGCRYGDALLAE